MPRHFCPSARDATRARARCRGAPKTEKLRSDPKTRVPPTHSDIPPMRDGPTLAATACWSCVVLLIASTIAAVVAQPYIRDYHSLQDQVAQLKRSRGQYQTVARSHSAAIPRLQQQLLACTTGRSAERTAHAARDTPHHMLATLTNRSAPPNEKPLSPAKALEVRRKRAARRQSRLTSAAQKRGTKSAPSAAP